MQSDVIDNSNSSSGNTPGSKSGSKSGSKPGKSMKRTLIKAGGIVIGLVIVLVACAPMLLSSYVRGSIEEEIAARVEGAVAVKSVSLGWFSPQKIEGISIDGGPAVGSVTLSTEVEQGLWSLAMGGDVALALSGSVVSAIGPDGRFALANCVKSSTSTPAAIAAPASGGSPPSAPPSSPPSSPFGTRKITIDIADIDLRAKSADGTEYAIENLHGPITFVDSKLSVMLEAIAASRGRTGKCALEVDADIVFGADGSIDVAKTSARVDIDTKQVALLTAAGEITIDSFALIAEKLANGACSLRVDSIARVADSAESRVNAVVDASSLFGTNGNFVLDPALITARIDIRALPLASLQPLAPELTAGTTLDFARDIGESVDLLVVKEAGDGARITLDTPRVKLTFQGDVAPDGSSIERGVLQASASVRPELLRAFAIDTATPLVVNLDGSQVQWSGANAAATAITKLGGVFQLKLASAFEVRGVADGVDARVETLLASIEKQSGDTQAKCRATATTRYGAAPLAASTQKNSASGTASVRVDSQVDFASLAIAGSMDADVVLDAATLEKFSAGALGVRGQLATVKISSPEFGYAPSESVTGLRAASGRVRVELAGALALAGAGTSAVVNDLAIDLALPTKSARGSIDVGAKIDGALTRIVQQFAAIPASFADPAQLGLEGTIDVKGLDPSFITRIAPAAAESIGLLGRGPMTLNAKNRTVDGALVADFALHSSTIDARGGVSYAKDAVVAKDLVLDATLTAEALASLPLGDDVELEPGVKIALRVPVFALARTKLGDADVWAPSGDLSASAQLDALRINRASGIHAPLALSRVNLDATYAFKDERATAKGSALLGGAKDASALAFDVAWKKPAEAKLFAGAEGTLALTDFNLAKFEAPLGLTPGSYSGMLGGAGSLSIAFSERGAAHAVVNAQFPKTRGALTLDVQGQGASRVLQASGEFNAEIAAVAFGKLAGMGDDPARRVSLPVNAACTISSLSVPLDANMAPVISDARLNLSGTLSTVAIEVTPASGARTTISTGALALTLKSERLADALVLQVSTAVQPASTAVQPAAASAAQSSSGSLNINATVRGAVAANATAKAKPAIDAVVKASRFPAATLDALAATNGAIVKYVGDSIDADITATNFSADQGALSAKITSQFASLDAPALTIKDGFARVSSAKPLIATFAMSPAVREELLTSINPIFADVVAGSPARFTLTNLAWPLTGDRRTFDGAFTLETGEVKLTNSGPLAFLLAAAGAGRSDGFDAYLEPLRGTIAKGRLTYRDFALRAGKTTSGGTSAGGAQWKNSLIFAGDIDLAAKPMYANSISTGVPLSDAASWSSAAKGIFDSIGAASPDLLKSLVVGVEMSGPLFDAAGKPAKLSMKLKLPDVGDLIRDDPGALIDAAGSIFDAIRGSDKPKPPKKPKAQKPKATDAPPPPPPQ